MRHSLRLHSLRSFLQCTATVTTAFVLAAPAFAQAAADQGGLEEIVVTAQRRAENLQIVPISVTAVTAKALASTGITDTKLLAQAVPSVQVTNSGPSTIFFIRGVGNSNAGTGEEGANAFYIDGVYLADLNQVNAEFNNLERVEVLKGPQGTLFGRNSSGGLINMITRDPGQNFEAQAKVGYGNYKTIRGQAYIAGPISETVSANLALTGRDQSKGYGKNFTTGKDTMLGYYYAARAKVVWRPYDTVKLTYAGDYYHSDDSFATSTNSVPGTRTITGVPSAGPFNRFSAQKGTVDPKVWGVSQTAEVDLGFADLTSITAYRRLKQTAFNDSDLTAAPTADTVIPSFSKTFQQETRLASAAGGPLNWQIGFFLFRSHAGVIDQFTAAAASNLTSKLTTKSLAGFGEVSYDFTPTTHLTLGLRYTDEKRKLFAIQTVAGVIRVNKKDRISYGKATYRAALRQDLSDDINIYASYNRGFKSGIWALQSPAAAPVKPQITDAFEVGFKSELFDRLIRLNLAGFHYQVKDYQVRSNPVGGVPSPILLNAAKVKVDGIEGEFVVVPSREINISGNFTWLKSRFSNFAGSAPFTYPRPGSCNHPAGGTAPAGTVPGQTTGAPIGGNIVCNGSATGNKTPLSPKFVASLSASYTFFIGDESELSFRGLYSYNSGYFFELDNRVRQPKYFIMNGSIEYKINDRYSVELWGNNITDKRYFKRILGSTTGDGGEFAPPRTYGASFTVNF